MSVAPITPTILKIKFNPTFISEFDPPHYAPTLTVPIPAQSQTRGPVTIVWFSVPQTLDSAQALEFIGFTPSVANAMIRTYRYRRDRNFCPMILPEYIRGHISQLNLRVARVMPPSQAMTHVGLTQSTQDCVMDPLLTPRGNAGSLYALVLQVLMARYRLLQALQQKIRCQGPSDGRVLCAQRQLPEADEPADR